MSTRCQIGFYSEPVEGEEVKLDTPDALIYRHSDGYPSGVLPDIMPFLEWWSTGRGIRDTEYCSARLLQYLCREYDAQDIEYAKETAEKYSNDASDNMRAYAQEKVKEIENTLRFAGTLGHGICKDFHGDIEYLYAVMKGGVKVYEVEFDADWNKPTPISTRLKLLGTVPYTKHRENTDYQKLTKRV